MFQSITNNLANFLAIYGYWAVLLFVAVESTGIPFPGETMLIFASIYAGTTHRLSIVLVIVAAAAGAIRDRGPSSRFHMVLPGCSRSSSFSTFGRKAGSTRLCGGQETILRMRWRSKKGKPNIPNNPPSTEGLRVSMYLHRPKCN